MYAQSMYCPFDKLPGRKAKYLLERDAVDVYLWSLRCFRHLFPFRLSLYIFMHMQFSRLLPFRVLFVFLLGSPDYG